MEGLAKHSKKVKTMIVEESLGHLLFSHVNPLSNSPFHFTKPFMPSLY